jgi:hypothetical protein
MMDKKERDIQIEDLAIKLVEDNLKNPLKEDYLYAQILIREGIILGMKISNEVIEETQIS